MWWHVMRSFDLTFTFCDYTFCDKFECDFIGNHGPVLAHIVWQIVPLAIEREVELALQVAR
jgi:hypothetical protein